MQKKQDDARKLEQLQFPQTIEQFQTRPQNMQRDVADLLVKATSIMQEKIMNKCGQIFVGFSFQVLILTPPYKV